MRLKVGFIATTLILACLPPSRLAVASPPDRDTPKTCDRVEYDCNNDRDQEINMCQHFPWMYPDTPTHNGIRDCYPPANDRYNRCIVETPCVD